MKNEVDVIKRTASSVRQKGGTGSAMHEPRLEFRRNMRCKWIWVLLSADAHIVNRSTLDFATDCVADADLNVFWLSDGA